MYYQTLVKNLFNDMHHFLNGVQAISLEDLKDNYQEEPLFLAFIGNLDQAAAVDYNAAMNESYAFYKKFCGKGLAEEDWDLVILEVQEFNKNWETIWCKGLILALLDILDREDRELRGEGQESGESSTQAEADGDMEQEGTELTEDDGQQEMEAA